MQDAALVQVGHRGQANVRVGTNVDALPRSEFRRPHVVEEDERSDHGFLGVWQYAANAEPAQIALLGCQFACHSLLSDRCLKTVDNPPAGAGNGYDGSRLKPLLQACLGVRANL